MEPANELRAKDHDERAGKNGSGQGKPIYFTHDIGIPPCPEANSLLTNDLPRINHDDIHLSPADFLAASQAK